MPNAPKRHRPTQARSQGGSDRHGWRKESNNFYTSAAWRKFRAHVLTVEPLCRQCNEEGNTEPATDCDHIVPLAEAPGLALEISNVQPLCKSHHSRKTQQERKMRTMGGGGE